MLEHVEQEGSGAELVRGDAAPPLFRKGTICGKYRIIRLLARGGMSEVFEAEHTELRKHVALKVLSPTLRTEHTAHVRFASEAINAACLVHTNIVDVVDCGVTQGLPYLVTNLLVGCDLAAHLARHGKLPPTDLIDILLPVAKAIAFGHEHGIVHRDLKPQNIFLHTEGTRIVPKVLDFGVSRVLGAPRITATMSVVGTPLYMAPEQARAESSVGPAADQYAFGVIMYEGLTGHLPRRSAQADVLLQSVAYGSFPPPSRYVKIPVGLEQLVLKAMASEPGGRFESMEELADGLLPYTSDARTRRAAGGGTNSTHITLARLDRALPPSAAEQEILDLPLLLQLLNRRRRFVMALLTCLLTLVAACMWLDNQSLAAEHAPTHRMTSRARAQP